MRLRRVKRGVADAVADLTDVPVSVSVGPILRRKDEHTHFIRLQAGSKFIEVALTEEELELPPYEITDKHIRPALAALLARVPSL